MMNEAEKVLVENLISVCVEFVRKVDAGGPFDIATSYSHMREVLQKAVDLGIAFDV